MNIEKGLFYTEDHEWVKVEGETAYIGITDYAQERMGDIVFVELPDVEEAFDEGDAPCVVESVKAASDVVIPFGCTVEEINEDVDDSPESINEQPYEQWLFKVTDFDEEGISKLMNADQYQAFVNELDD